MSYTRTISNYSQWVALSLMVKDRLRVKSDPFEITIGETQRTSKQNSLLHAIFKQCADKTKIKTIDWWKEELKSKLGKKEVHFDLNDNPTIIIVSTTKYSKPEMADFVIKIQVHMITEHQVEIDIKEAQTFLEG